MNADTPERDYEVGYGKPPAQTRFKSGQSGNPSGRRKAPKTLGSVVHAELNRKVTLSVNGDRVSLAMRDVVGKQLVKKAADGDFRAIRLVLALEVAFMNETVNATGAVEIQVSKDDEEFLETFIQQIKDGEQS